MIVKPKLAAAAGHAFAAGAAHARLSAGVLKSGMPAGISTLYAVR